MSKETDTAMPSEHGRVLDAIQIPCSLSLSDLHSFVHHLLLLLAQLLCLHSSYSYENLTLRQQNYPESCSLSFMPPNTWIQGLVSEDIMPSARQSV